MSGLKDGLGGKVAVVTGASTPKGIGNAIARRYAAEGAALYLVAEGTEQQLKDAVEACRALSPNGAKVESGQFDLAEPGAPEAMIEIALETHGRVDILVNNAGIPGAGIKLEEMSMDTWRQCIAICLDGVFLGIKHGIRAMKQGTGGSIVNISSIAGKIGIPTSGNYCAAKGGVTLLTKTAALECADDDPVVRVNSVHPGFIDTDMVAGAIQHRGPWFRQYIEDMVPMAKLGEADDIAEGIVYLASDAAKFVTGSELVIDGGYLAR